MIQLKTKQKVLLGLSLATLVLFVVFTLLVAFVDVEEVGFARINHFFWEHCGRHVTWEKITKWMGYFALLAVVVILVWQIVQWVQRKSLRRVDQNLLLWNVVGVAFLAVYLFFELVTINYRPMLENGVAKASYPSSHTMLFATVLPLLIYQVWHYIKNQPWRIVLTVALGLFLVVGVVGRMFAGVHWFTDIIGGVIISCSFVCFYLALAQNNGK